MQALRRLRYLLANKIISWTEGSACADLWCDARHPSPPLGAVAVTEAMEEMSIKLQLGWLPCTAHTAHSGDRPVVSWAGFLI